MIYSKVEKMLSWSEENIKLWRFNGLEKAKNYTDGCELIGVITSKLRKFLNTQTFLVAIWSIVNDIPYLRQKKLWKISAWLEIFILIQDQKPQLRPQEKNI